jgi:hypothetical protein
MTPASGSSRALDAVAGLDRTLADLRYLSYQWTHLFVRVADNPIRRPIWHAGDWGVIRGRSPAEPNPATWTRYDAVRRSTSGCVRL